jgi:hypothetical protein
MFETLDEQMKHDEEATTTKKERILRYILTLVVAIVVFGGLYMGVQLLTND